MLCTYTCLNPIISFICVPSPRYVHLIYQSKIMIFKRNQIFHKFKNNLLKRTVNYGNGEDTKTFGIKTEDSSILASKNKAFLPSMPVNKYPWNIQEV